MIVRLADQGSEKRTNAEWRGSPRWLWGTFRNGK